MEKWSNHQFYTDRHQKLNYINQLTRTFSSLTVNPLPPCAPDRAPVMLQQQESLQYRKQYSVIVIIFAIVIDAL